MTLVYLTLRRLHGWRFLGPFASGAAVVALAYAVARRDVGVVYLPPALRSVWFVPHVVVYFVAHAALFAAAVAAILVVIRRRGDLEEGVYAVVKFGFTALTLGLALGAIWAKFVWGDYWSWDPKETWALVTWLVYLAYLHVRKLPGWRGKPSAVVVLVGFAVVLMTYLGMHLLPSAGESLHAYQ